MLTKVLRLCELIKEIFEKSLELFLFFINYTGNNYTVVFENLLIKTQLYKNENVLQHLKEKECLYLTNFFIIM